MAGYPVEIMDAVDNERRVLNDPKYQEILQKMLNGTRVSGSEAKVVVMALTRICTELQWPAKRYAHMRHTYVVGQVNSATRQMLALGVKVHVTDGSVWAKDGGFGWPSYVSEGPHQPDGEALEAPQ